MINENMIIGSHSVNHKLMSELSLKDMRQEIDKVLLSSILLLRKKLFLSLWR